MTMLIIWVMKWLKEVRKIFQEKVYVELSLRVMSDSLKSAILWSVGCRL